VSSAMDVIFSATRSVSPTRLQHVTNGPSSSRSLNTPAALHRLPSQEPISTTLQTDHRHRHLQTSSSNGGKAAHPSLVPLRICSSLGNTKAAPPAVRAIIHPAYEAPSQHLNSWPRPWISGPSCRPNPLSIDLHLRSGTRKNPMGAV
jgi:hypothetical protein